jgi:hypothetical protein
MGDLSGTWIRFETIEGRLMRNDHGLSSGGERMGVALVQTSRARQMIGAGGNHQIGFRKQPEFKVDS